MRGQQGENGRQMPSQGVEKGSKGGTDRDKEELEDRLTEEEEGVEGAVHQSVRGKGQHQRVLGSQS